MSCVLLTLSTVLPNNLPIKNGNKRPALVDKIRKIQPRAKVDRYGRKYLNMLFAF